MSDDDFRHGRYGYWVKVRLTPPQVTLLERLTGESDMIDVVQRVLEMTVAMAEECDA